MNFFTAGILGILIVATACFGVTYLHFIPSGDTSVAICAATGKDQLQNITDECPASADDRVHDLIQYPKKPAVWRIQI
jgi:hypothetical protein